MPSSILNLKFKGNKSFVAFSNLGDSDALTKTWKVCTKVASYLEQGQRLENLSWRLWHLQNLIVDTDNAKSKREFKKLSKCMGDKLDKEKGRSIEELEAPDYKLNPAAEKLRQRAEEKERSRYESATHASGRPLNRMQFTFSVDQPAGSFSETPGPLSGVRKPDLKPSSQFRDTVHRRRPATRASAAQAENDNNQHASDTKDSDMNDPPSLTQLGRRPSPPPDLSSDANAYGTWSDNNSGSVAENSYSNAALRFPTLFNSDFGPSALLFPQPSLVTRLSYGEDAATGRDREAFHVLRPTIELTLDEILKDVARNELELERNPGSPGGWSSSPSSGGGDAEMMNSSAQVTSDDTQENIPSTIHPSQVSSTPSSLDTPTPSSGRSGKPLLTVRTSSSRSNGPSASLTGASASAGRGEASGFTAPGGIKAECSNCGATHTPLWRRGLNDELNCNACGLYCKLHKRPRPKSMRSQHGEGRHQSSVRSDSTDALGEPAQCYNCHTTTTPLWRKDDEGKTVCNACGLYFKLHGSSRPISMKSDIIRKRSRHDARRAGPGETPSASPGASRRASPSSGSGGSSERLSPTLAPDSSTAQPAYSFSPEDYDFDASGNANATEYSSNGMGMGASSLFSSTGHFDPSGLMFTHQFPGPYHPDLLQRTYFGDDSTRNSTANVNVQRNSDDEDRMSKRRRMSVDSASEPPSSTASFSSYATEETSATTVSRSSLDFGLGFGTSAGGNSGNNGFTYMFESSGNDTLRQQGGLWHPPMLPQTIDKSPACFVHPPMLPSDDNSMGFGSGNKDFPMDFLHPPMMPGSSNGGREEDHELFGSYLHPPMVVNNEDSPMAPLSGLQPHPPMLPSNEYYSHQGQEHHGYQQHQQQELYHRQSDHQRHQQQQQDQINHSYQQQLEHEHEHHEQQQRYYEQFGSVH